MFHPQPVNCDFYGEEYYDDSCYLYSMENSWWEQELHPYNQYEEKRLSNIENVFKANQNSIRNLEIQVDKLVKEVVEIPFLVTREENFVEVKAHGESLWEKCSQVEIEQESLLQGRCGRHFSDHQYFPCNDMEGISVIHDFHGVSS
ncbi:hypothetical protein HKD37_15G042641 [Glycine soja]